FIEGFDFVRMRPDETIIKGGVSDKARARALSESGKQYAIYINGGGQTRPGVELPPGGQARPRGGPPGGRWATPAGLRPQKGRRTIESPEYQDDIALRIKTREK